jgi:hypothetical protein
MTLVPPLTRIGTLWSLLVLGFSPSASRYHPTADIATSGDSLRIVVSVADRQLWVLNAAGDTVYSAEVAVGSGKTLLWRGKRWTLATPLGERRVVSKEKNPVWIPPLWDYVEQARLRGLTIVELQRDRGIVLGDGRLLTVRADSMGLIGGDSTFQALLATRYMVFDGVLYVPPFGTVNRRVIGMLGAYRLNLGKGLGLHGTPDHASIPQPVTHGCIRLHDADIE